MIDYNTPLVTTTISFDATTVRKAMVSNALSVVGFSATDHRKEFETLLGPNNEKWDLDRPFAYINGKTQGTSCCGLVARGLMRRMNVNHPPIYKPYIPGTAISAEISLAQKNKAWQTYKPNTDLKPSPGDIVVIGSGMSTHILTAVDWNDDTLVSVDGGQVRKSDGLQWVNKVERLWSIKNNMAFLGTKQVVGWIVLDLLPFNIQNGSLQITAPTGWDS